MLGGVLFSGCKKGFLDVNTNPNNPQTVAPGLILPAAEVKTAAVVVDPNLATLNVWMDYWAFSPNYAVAQDVRDYKVTPSTFGGAWNDLYTNAYDYQNIINASVISNDPAMEGIGRTMKSFLMQWAVDMWNNVPYSEAFKAALNQTPAYQSGQVVYDSLYIDLNRAIAKFKTPNITTPTSAQDVMFGGNMKKWIKFANTIKLRILLREFNKLGLAAIQSKIAADSNFAGGNVDNLFLQAGESALVNPGYANTPNKQSPFFSNFGYDPAGTKLPNNDYYKIASYEASFYASQDDYRLFYVAKNVSAGGVILPAWGGTFHFLGNEMGTQGTTTNTYSDVTDDKNGGAAGDQPYHGPTDPQPIMADFESLFLQSEAIQRGLFTGDAQAKFELGELQSFIFDFDRVDGAGSGASYITNLVPTPQNNWAMAPDKIALIITQKWAALNEVNFWEPYIEYRRTGAPNITLSSSPTRANNVPVRLPYPQTEFDLNGAHVGSQGGTNILSDKVWWML